VYRSLVRTKALTTLFDAQELWLRPRGHAARAGWI